jgi:hypothetical protein
MFLHSGASFHGHEFGGQGNAPRRNSLMISSFTPISRKPVATEAYPPPIINRTRARRPFSEYIPRNEQSVRFQEPEVEMLSEDETNCSGSEASTFGRHRRRRTIRTCTTFHMAHPAPALSQIQKLLEIRPKLILQLQQLSAGARPLPSIDVLPSNVFVPRLVKRFPRMFRDKWELSYNDVMIVRSEDYNSAMDHYIEESDSDDDGLANRELLAVICQLRKDNGGHQGMAEIVLHDGTVWIATPLPNGTFEFVTRNHNGLLTTARWVRRINKNKSVDLSNATLGSMASGSTDDFKYTFSLINPNSRRHPIMGTMTKNRLEIPDYYTSVSSSAGRYPPTSPIGAFPSESDYPFGEDEPAPERTTHEIDDNTKTLIQISAIWVALRQGWSPYFKYNDAMTSATAASNSLGSCRGRARSASVTPDSCRPSPAPSITGTPDSHHSNLKTVIGNKIRRVSISRSSSSGTSGQFENPVLPKRSTSHGSAFMERVTARKLANTPSNAPADSDATSTMGTRTRASTLNGRRSVPPALPPASPTTPRPQGSIPSTPTRLQKRPPSRPQSVYIPSSTYETGYFQNNYFEAKPQRQSMILPDVSQAADTGGKSKFGRWRSITNIFRRPN